MTRYTANLMRVMNNKSKKIRYFAEVCGIMVRIGEKDWDLKKDLADGLEKVGVSLGNDYTRHNVTAVYYL